MLTRIFCRTLLLQLDEVVVIVVPVDCARLHRFCRGRRRRQTIINPTTAEPFLQPQTVHTNKVQQICCHKPFGTATPSRKCN